MSSLVFFLALGAQLTSAFPFVAKMPGVDSSILKSRSGAPVKRQSDQASCPFNPNHKGAAPFDPRWPYTGAQKGLPGSQIGGIKVPADGDTAHAFDPPTAQDIRGPCPGLNAAANHHFLSHDGITNFNELVDAQQNVYNVGYDLAVTLAVLGISLDGDVVTERLSLGCDATSRTSLTGSLLGDELGLNGYNKFEGDTSLTRSDYFLGPAFDDHSFNGTLFAAMQSTCKGNFDVDNIALYRSQRYHDSLTTNGNFYFGPKAVLLYGAATFLYELFPSFGPAGSPDLPTISSFFGAVSDGKGGWKHVAERIPENWFSRKLPFTGPDVTVKILELYAKYPVLFGGNAGVGTFVPSADFGSAIRSGKLVNDPVALRCLLYQIATENVPSSLTGVLTLPLQVVRWATGKLNPVFQGSGCPLK